MAHPKFCNSARIKCKTRNQCEKPEQGKRKKSNEIDIPVYNTRHTTKGNYYQKEAKSKICLHPATTDIGIVLDKEADCT